MKSGSKVAVPLTLPQKAIVSPISSFEHPSEVVAADDLTFQEKTDVLKQWENDAKSLQRATDEGMSGGSPPRLGDVNAAQTMLSNLKSRSRDVRGVNNNVETPAKTLSGDNARQGVTGHNVRYVLAYGLLGTILSLVLVALYLSRT
jgi:hypothetical protein